MNKIQHIVFTLLFAIVVSGRADFVDSLIDKFNTSNEPQAAITIQNKLAAATPETLNQVAFECFDIIQTDLLSKVPANNPTTEKFVSYINIAKLELITPKLYNVLKTWVVSQHGNGQIDLVVGSHNELDLAVQFGASNYTVDEAWFMLYALQEVGNLGAKLNADPIIELAYKRESLRTKKWSSYFNEAIPQWPWETIINGNLYKSAGDAMPPEKQLIILHPDIAMEYMPDAGDGQQFKAMFTVEFGVNFWKWEDDGSMSGPLFGKPFGAGLVAGFVDRDDTDDWGYGAVLHFNNKYNLGVMFRDSDPAYFVSVNITKLFQDANKNIEKVKEYF